MLKRWGLILGLVLLGFGQVKAADSITVRGQVTLSPIYSWSVQRQSEVTVPTEISAGDQLSISGNLRRSSGVPLINHDILLLLGQGDQTIASDQTRTDASGRFTLSLDGDSTWRGQMWLSVVVLTYGHPLWLIDHQLVVWLAPKIDGVTATTVWHIDVTIDAVVTMGNTQVLTGEYHATIKPNANIENDVERRVGSVAGDLLARGRDSPVVDRSFGVCRWTVG